MMEGTFARSAQIALISLLLASTCNLAAGQTRQVRIQSDATLQSDTVDVGGPTMRREEGSLVEEEHSGSGKRKRRGGGTHMAPDSSLVVDAAATTSSPSGSPSSSPADAPVAASNSPVTVNSPLPDDPAVVNLEPIPTLESTKAADEKANASKTEALTVVDPNGVDATPRVAEVVEGGLKSLEAKTGEITEKCDDIHSFTDLEGYGCDAYGLDFCVNGTNVSVVEVPALRACCACGGGLITEIGEGPTVHKVITSRVGLNGEDVAGECQWVNVANETIWKCDHGVFVVCATDEDCNTQGASAALGFTGFKCHGPPLMQSGMCIPPTGTPAVNVATVTPSADDKTFFKASEDGHFERVSPDVTDHEAVKKTGHPCCCAAPHSASLLQAGAHGLDSVDTLLMQRQAIKDLAARGVTGDDKTVEEIISQEEARTSGLVDMEKSVAAALQAQMGEIARKAGTGMKLLTDVAHEGICKEIDCKDVECAAAPPVVVTRFKVESGNGVPLIGARLEEFVQKKGCSEGTACVGMEEPGMPWDPRENQIHFVAAAKDPAGPPVSLADGMTVQLAVKAKRGKELPEFGATAPELESEIAPLVVAETVVTMFLVDVSASTAPHVRALVSRDLGRMYTELCDPADKEMAPTPEPPVVKEGQASVDVHASVTTALMQRNATADALTAAAMLTDRALTRQDLKVVKRCGFYSFDGADHLTPVVPFQDSKSLPSPREVSTLLSNLHAEDRSTNLYGALVEAKHLFDSQPGANASTFTIVLVSDAEERAHRVTKEAAMEALDDVSTSIYGLFIDKGDAKSPAAEEFMCIDLIQSNNKKCCTKEPASDEEASHCAAIKAGTFDMSLDEENRGLSEDANHLHSLANDATAKLQTAVAASEAATQIDAQIERANRTAQSVEQQEDPDAMRVVRRIMRQRRAARDAAKTERARSLKEGIAKRRDYEMSLRSFKRREAKHRMAVRRFNARTQLAFNEHKALATNMIDSWGEAMSVYDTMVREGQYAVAMCSSYRPSADGADHREGDLLVASPHVHSEEETEEEHAKFKPQRYPMHFSSRSFHVPECTQLTLRAVLGLTVDATAGKEAVKADKEESVSMAAAAKSAPVASTTAAKGSTGAASQAGLSSLTVLVLATLALRRQ